MTLAPLRIGTAGWSIATRYADRVPAGGSHLERYARLLDAVEINSSFHRPHRRTTYERWAASTPADFRFAVKMPKAVTHERRLADCSELLDRFFSEVGGLGQKLAVLLVQLPPKFVFDADAMERFLREVRARTETPVALEPRHASWFTPNVDRWLSARGVARVAADPAKIPVADQPGGWNGLAYYRWHGSPRMYYSDYDAAALMELRQRLAQDRARGAAAWCIFDNTASSAALGNALSLAFTPD